MHLYLYVRGKFEQVELWKSLVQGYYFKWRRFNNKTKEEEIKLVQMALRPSVLGACELVFPKEALPAVCAFLGIRGNESYGFGKIGRKTRHAFLRKIFGAKKIPKKILKEAEKIPSALFTEEYEIGVANCQIPGAALHPIGIKEDEIGVMGDYTQEML